MSEAETKRKFDSIVDFADIGKFMDTPVSHYSSGMYARLAFSVAVHVEPDVLLVDEVLSVGDAAFQDRSLRRMLEFRDRRQAAIVFVSHNLSAVELMCPRAVWLERGTARVAGATSDVLRAYLDAVDTADERGEDVGQVRIDSVTVLPTSVIRADCPTGTSRSRWWSPLGARELVEPVFVVTIRGDHGRCSREICTLTAPGRRAYRGVPRGVRLRPACCGRVGIESS
jgi:energy-coupling factor transporter ATP-binding protein EcfA2